MEIAGIGIKSSDIHKTQCIICNLYIALTTWEWGGGKGVLHQKLNPGQSSPKRKLLFVTE